MKPLEELTNVEKAKLLYQLFPAEMPALIIYTLDLAIGVIERVRDNEVLPRQLSKEDWIAAANNVYQKIGSFGMVRTASYHLFGDQLFEGNGAYFMIYSLHLYIHTRQHPNRQFTAAVELLFHP